MITFGPDADCSVIIPSNRDGLGLPHLLLHLREDPARLQVIVVQAGRSPAVAQVKDRFPLVTVVNVAPGSTPGACRNAGLSEAQCENIVFIDVDVRPTHSTISRGLATLASERSLVGLGTSILPPKGGTYANWVTWFVEFSEWLPGTGLWPTRMIPTCFAMYRKEVLKAIGGFEEGRELSEDTVLSYRLRERGWKLAVLRDASVAHVDERTTMRAAVKHQGWHGAAYAHAMRTTRRSTSSARGMSGSWMFVWMFVGRVLGITARIVVHNPRHFLRWLWCLPGAIVVLTRWTSSYCRVFFEDSGDV